MHTHDLPMHLFRALGQARFAAGALVTVALLSAASGDSASPVNSSTLRSGMSGSPSAAASTVVVLANASVTCTNGTITGDVGTFLPAPTGSVTKSSCPIAGTVHVGDAAAKQAFNDFLNTYAALAPKAGNVCTTLTGTLAGITLSPGAYCFTGAATVTGVLTLNGKGSWTFNIGTGGTGALTGTNFSVVMAGGAQACNVTWRVAQAAAMTTSTFHGNILAGAGITLTGGTFNGHASSKADVTITGTAVTGC